ncbi:MAG TPA: hypothetical protein VK548_03695 [Candidatus Acidoferrum sp.]|nr:hypothetical protein [Candidatus Acidoferrum sp.]
MTMTVGRASRFSVAIGVALIVLLSVASPALADGCSAEGKFTFTVPAGFGFLFLSADGTVEMGLVLGHDICPVCGGAGRFFTGTYRTNATDQGCSFEMVLSTPPPIAHTDKIAGVVAFEGRQILFLVATSPDFASGLALRNDALTGR